MENSSNIDNTDILDFQIAGICKKIGITGTIDTEIFWRYQPILADTDGR